MVLQNSLAKPKLTPNTKYSMAIIYTQPQPLVRY